MADTIFDTKVAELADDQQRIVESNNAMKIFNYNESIRHAKSYTDRGLAVPAGYEPKIPTLTRFDRQKYMELYMADQAEAQADVRQGGGGEQAYANLDEAFVPYQYEPPSDPVVVAPTQPKNPLGVLLDDDMGIFARAIGDTLPVGSKFTMMGTDFILTSFGGQIGGKRLFWIRQG